MAFLQNLIVSGNSRFLNKSYMNDLDISGTFTTSDITANGSITATEDIIGVNGNFSDKVIAECIELSRGIPYIDFHFGKSTADYTARIIEQTSGTITIKPNLLVGTSATIPTATITTGIISTANISTANITTGNANNFNVVDILHATRYDLQSVAQLGGAFYVAPTIKFPTDSNTSFIITKNEDTLTIVITDSALVSSTLAGVVWQANGLVKASGKIGNISTGTMTGTLTNLNISNTRMTISVSGENSSEVTAGTYSATDIEDFNVMLYNVEGNPVGIMMNSYGTDGRTYIDVYGGTSTSPNVRIGNLGGLSFNGNTLTNQWGIFTDNGYFTGAIKANSGIIGGFTIGSSAIYTGTLTDNTDDYIGLSTEDFTRTIGNTSRSGLRFAIGNKVGITGDGIIYSSNIQATGGAIGGWNIGSNDIHKVTNISTGTASTQYGLFLTSSNTAQAQIIKAGSRSYDGSAYGSWDLNFYVRNDGYLYSKAGNIAGWSINTENGFLYGTWGTDGGIILAPKGTIGGKSVGGSSSISGWSITSGANFGVTTSGAVYCSDIHATGEITATSGYIGTTTNGFIIDASGFYSGTKTDNNSGYIAMSNTTFSRTINDTALTNLNLAIGSKFGVTSDGTLYANGLNIKNIDADNISIGTLSIERLTSLQIGGRNYFAIINSEDGYLTTSGTIHANDSYKEYTTDYIPVVTGEYWTVSCTNVEEKEPWIGYCFYDSNKTFVSPRVAKYEASIVGFVVPDGVSYMRVSYRTHDYIVNCKLEKGNKITDWSPAPEDVDSAISSVKDIADTALSQGVEYIVGTQTATTASWTGVTTDSTLVAGKTIAYKLPKTSASNATLNLTLSTGATTGAKAVYYNNTRVSTQYPANSIIHMTYDGSYWRITNYNSDTQNRIRLQNIITAAEAITTGHIICGTSSGYRDIKANVSFDLTYPLLYAATTKAKGATSDNNFLSINGINASNNGTITSGTTGKTLYLKGTVNNNTFTISASPFMTTVVPTTEDGFIYMPLGIMYSATNIYFISTDKLYAYKDGGFKELSRGEASLAAKTATNYLYYDTTNGLVISSSASSQTYSGASTGYNTRLTNSALQIRNGTNVLASYGDTVIIGESGKSQQVIDDTSLRFRTSTGQDSFVIDNEATGENSNTISITLNPTSYTETDIKTAIVEALDNYSSYGNIVSNEEDEVVNPTIENTTVAVYLWGEAYLSNVGYHETATEQYISVTNVSVSNGVLTATLEATTTDDWTDAMTELISYFPSDSTIETVGIDIILSYPIKSVCMTVGTRDEQGTIGVGSVSIGKGNIISGAYSFGMGVGLYVSDSYCMAIGEGVRPIFDITSGEKEAMAFIVGANGANAFGVSQKGTLFFSGNNCGKVANTSVGSNKKATVTISFPQSFPVPPFVLVSLIEQGTLNNQTNINDYGKIQIYVHEVTQTTLTVFIINNGSTSHTVEWSWFAFCDVNDLNE